MESVKKNFTYCKLISYFRHPHFVGHNINLGRLLAFALPSALTMPDNNTFNYTMFVFRFDRCIMQHCIFILFVLAEDNIIFMQIVARRRQAIVIYVVEFRRLAALPRLLGWSFLYLLRSRVAEGLDVQGSVTTSVQKSLVDDNAILLIVPKEWHDGYDGVEPRRCWHARHGAKLGRSQWFLPIIDVVRSCVEQVPVVLRDLGLTLLCHGILIRDSWTL